MYRYALHSWTPNLQEFPTSWLWRVTIGWEVAFELGITGNLDIGSCHLRFRYGLMSSPNVHQTLIQAYSAAVPQEPVELIQDPRTSENGPSFQTPTLSASHLFTPVALIALLRVFDLLVALLVF